jgi:hypothetical protein
VLRIAAPAGAGCRTPDRTNTDELGDRSDCRGRRGLYQGRLLGRYLGFLQRQALGMGLLPLGGAAGISPELQARQAMAFAAALA